VWTPPPPPTTTTTTTTTKPCSDRASGCDPQPPGGRGGGGLKRRGNCGHGEAAKSSERKCASERVQLHIHCSVSSAENTQDQQRQEWGVCGSVGPVSLSHLHHSLRSEAAARGPVTAPVREPKGSTLYRPEEDEEEEEEKKKKRGNLAVSVGHVRRDHGRPTSNNQPSNWKHRKSNTPMLSCRSSVDDIVVHRCGMAHRWRGAGAACSCVK
ncbi:hypothetical protein INR49_009431, partial [Caranx melampygus]